MCGIAGVWFRDGAPQGDASAAARRDVAAMLAAISHRGPDGSRIVENGAGVLGACRLAIFDPERGAQPMATADGRHALALNGAIVNFSELADELRAEGAAFRTRCDTEVALELVARRGTGAFAAMNGMFAVASFDGADGSAVLARDPCGIKPLVWTDLGDRVLFASEAKALLAVLPARPGPDRESVLDYLAFQVPLGDRTFFRGIRRVPPGAMLLLRRGRAPEEAPLPAWREPPRVPDDPAEAAAALRELLADAVRVHLRADVPLGAHLSGGTDSSYLAAAAARAVGGPIDVFTGAFDVAGFDERPHARAVAEEIGARAHETVPTPEDLLAALAPAAFAMDEPMAGPGLLPQWFVAREAARRVKVVLGGQGGDELFSGYVRHLVLRLEGALVEAMRGGDTRTLRGLAPHLSSLDGYEPLLRRQFASGLFGDPADRAFSLVHRGGGLEGALAGDLAAEFAAHPARGRFQHAFDVTSGRDPVDRLVRFDRKHLLPALLHVEDRTSMAHSLESRVPFLDRRVLAFVDAAPPAALYGDGELKHLLRRAVERDLPRAARERRDKMGFPVPLAVWARGPLRKPLADMLLGGALRARGHLREDAVPRLLEGQSVEARHLWALVNLELWTRAFDA
ncbi:MAG: Asparagine synthetase [glutamine-hydrolyzing] 1 [Planctomycetes bacterium]|nr:Asparagine synthetase [glutamine-hydrolyzing] 1 [Planctomycetota bacterium]